jgi:hypothetical protein
LSLAPNRTCELPGRRQELAVILSPSPLPAEGPRSSVLCQRAKGGRWLLDRQMRAEHERTFFEYAGKLATFNNGQTFEKAYAIEEGR